jgi:hypothetical protein
MVVMQRTRRIMSAPPIEKINGMKPKDRFPIVWNTIEPNKLPSLTIKYRVIRIEIIMVYMEYPSNEGNTPNSVRRFCVVPSMKKRGKCQLDQIMPKITEDLIGV